MLGPDGRELYRRTLRLSRVKTELSIRGWPANDAEGPIGLDPGWEYCLIPGPRHETWVQVDRLSSGVTIRGYRQRDGFALLSLGTPAGLKPVESVSLEYRLAVSLPRTYVDGKLVQPQPRGDAWRLVVPADSTIVFLSGAVPQPAVDGLVGDLHDQGQMLPTEGPAMAMEMTRGPLREMRLTPPGIPREPGYLAATPDRVRLTFDNVVEVPGADAVLRLHGYHSPSPYGDGQRALIAINGRLVFDTVLLPRENKHHEWSIPLGPYAGQPVLITVASDPRASANADNMRLSRPRIVRDPMIKEPTHRLMD
jgi:hypothetical protein